MGKKSRKDLLASREEASAEAGTASKASKAAAVTGFVPCDRPSPRCHFSLTEVSPGRLLLFGGEVFNGKKFTCYQDLYELRLLDGGKVAWRKLELGGADAPRARSAHQAVAWKGALWVFGGEWADASQEKILQFKDVWCLELSDDDGAHWEQLSAEKGFSSRAGHRACVHDGAIVIFGGYSDDAGGDAKYLNDVHRFDLTQRKFRKGEDLNGAKPKGRSAGQVWSDGHAVWVYGGSTPAPKQKGVKEHMDALPDLWRLDLGKWTGPVAVAGESPGARSGFASAPVPDLVGSGMGHLRLFFGGVTDRFGLKKEEVSAFHNDAWVLDTKALTWARLDLAPCRLQGRIGAQLTPAHAPGRGDALVLFGGMAEAGPREITMDDLWIAFEEPAEGEVAASKRWTCLLPLSGKTRTWFQDNDADSSDEEEGGVGAGVDKSGGPKTASAKKRDKKNQKQQAKEADGAAGEAVAEAPSGKDLEDEKAPSLKKAQRKAKKGGKSNGDDEVLSEEELAQDEKAPSSKKAQKKGKEAGKSKGDDRDEISSAEDIAQDEKAPSSKKAQRKGKKAGKSRGGDEDGDFQKEEPVEIEEQKKETLKFEPKSRVAAKAKAKSGFAAMASDSSDSDA